MTFTRYAFIVAAVIVVTGTVFAAEPIEKKGTTPYLTHFIFIPVKGIEISGLGTATLLEAVGITQNLKGEKMLDKMSAHCTASVFHRVIKSTSTALVFWTTMVTRSSRPLIPETLTSHRLT